jgi:CelD/BcsL family acetyltransferase involved in cellulose biosynthesis
MADQGEVRLVRERSADGRTQAAREAIALKRAWLADRGLRNPALASDELADTLTAALTDPDGAAPFEVFRLTVGGRTAAIEVGLIDGLTYRSYLGAYAPDFADHGPGKLLTADVARWCRAQGLEAYDLLPPVTDFKRSWCDGRREMSRAVVPLRHRARLMLPLIRSGRGLIKQAYHGLSKPQRAWLNAAADRIAAQRDG